MISLRVYLDVKKQKAKRPTWIQCICIKQQSTRGFIVTQNDMISIYIQNKYIYYIIGNKTNYGAKINILVLILNDLL